MKMNQLFAICGIAAALFMGANYVSAQNGGGGFGGQGGNSGGGGGGFRNRGGFDPTQIQKEFMDFARTYMNFTNDEDWSAVQPLVQKVADARRAMMSDMGNGIRKMIEARRNADNGGDQGGGNRRFRGGMFGGQPSAEYTSLENAVDNNAPESQIKDLLAKYQSTIKAKQDTLKKAEDSLRSVLTPKQEAAATVLGLLD